MRAIGTTAFLILFSAGYAQAEPVAWSLDKAHSHIGFSVRHLAITNVRGEFKDFDATVMADAKTGKITSVEATAKTASVDTGVEKRDAHLRKDDFFDSEMYPTMSLVTRSIKFSGKKFTATVDLTIRDVTKTVTFKGEMLGPEKVNFGDGEQFRVGYQAEATINRKDFGLKFGAITEGVAVVGDSVKITLEVELWRKL